MLYYNRNATPLKRLGAIFMLIVFLFNLVGYKLFFYYQIQHANARLEARILSHLPDSQLITLKIPLKLPYLTESSSYEDIEGEMEIYGVNYKYIKKKIEKDTLVLLCIDHKEKSQLQKKSSDYFSKVNDLASKGKKKALTQQVKTDFFEVSLLAVIVSHYTFISPSKPLFKKKAPAMGYLKKIPHPPESLLS